MPRRAPSAERQKQRKNQSSGSSTRRSRTDSLWRSIGQWAWKHIRALIVLLLTPVRKLRSLRNRRTHKSFIRSRRRDYVRTLSLPGVLKLTAEAVATLARRWKLFLLLTVVFAGLALLLGGLSGWQLYDTVVSTVTNEDADLSGVMQTLTLLASSANLLSAGLSEAQQIYVGIILLLTWLVTVWLLREIIAGHRPRLRDGLYSAGAPIVATTIVLLLLLIQLIPAGLMAIAYGALSATGLISEGLGAFLFFGTAALVAILTLYWLTSTFIALVIITLPGMYPWQAMKAASDIIVGRRLQVLYRVIWLIVTVVLLWGVVMTPIILLDGWLRGLYDWYAMVPLVPVAAVWLSVISAVWCATYIYLLYRKVVAGDAESSK